MGFTPQQVDRMSLWELSASVDGWVKANSASEPLEAMSPEEFDDMLERNASFLGMH